MVKLRIGGVYVRTTQQNTVWQGMTFILEPSPKNDMLFKLRTTDFRYFMLRRDQMGMRGEFTKDENRASHFTDTEAKSFVTSMGGKIAP